MKTEVEDERLGPRATHLEGSGSHISSSDGKQRAERREVKESYRQTEAMATVNGDSTSTTQTHSKRGMLGLKWMYTGPGSCDGHCGKYCNLESHLYNYVTTIQIWTRNLATTLRPRHCSCCPVWPPPDIHQHGLAMPVSEGHIASSNIFKFVFLLLLSFNIVFVIFIHVACSVVCSFSLICSNYCTCTITYTLSLLIDISVVSSLWTFPCLTFEALIHAFLWVISSRMMAS